MGPFADGQVITGSRDATVRVWKVDSESADGASATCTHTLSGHTHFVGAVGITAAGEALSGSNDKHIIIWNTEAAAPAHVLQGHTEPVTCVRVSPSSGQLFSASWDKTARVWDLGSASCVAVLKGHEAALWAVQPLGEEAASDRCLTGGGDRTIKLWAGETCERTYEGHSDVVRDLALLPGASLPCRCSPRHATRPHGAPCVPLAGGLPVVLERRDGEDVGAGRRVPARAAGASPAGRGGGCGAEEGTGRRRGGDGAGGREGGGEGGGGRGAMPRVASPQASETFLYSVSVLPGGEWLTCSEDRTVRVWAGGSDDCVQSITHPATVWDCAPLPNGERRTRHTPRPRAPALARQPRPAPAPLRDVEMVGDGGGRDGRGPSPRSGAWSRSPCAPHRQESNPTPAPSPSPSTLHPQATSSPAARTAGPTCGRARRGGRRRRRCGATPQRRCPAPRLHLGSRRCRRASRTRSLRWRCRRSRRVAGGALGCGWLLTLGSPPRAGGGDGRRPGRVAAGERGGAGPAGRAGGAAQDRQGRGRHADALHVVDGKGHVGKDRRGDGLVGRHVARQADARRQGVRLPLRHRHQRRAAARPRHVHVRRCDDSRPRHVRGASL